MSYDLMVFDPTAASTNCTDFMHWYKAQTNWPAANLPCPTSLRARLEEMQTQFPDMNAMTDNELDADENAEISRATEYSFGQQVVYVSFAWSAQAEAYATMTALAAKHNVGFFDASSSNGEIVWVWQARP